LRTGIHPSIQRYCNEQCIVVTPDELFSDYRLPHSIAHHKLMEPFGKDLLRVDYGPSSHQKVKFLVPLLLLLLKTFQLLESGCSIPHESTRRIRRIELSCQAFMKGLRIVFIIVLSCYLVDISKHNFTSTKS
jgi:hypothetical protein